MLWLFYLMTLAAGAANPLQAGTNAELNRQLEQPIRAGLIVYAIGFSGLLLFQFLFGRAFPLCRAGRTHWWAWLGGLISIASTMAALSLAHKLGSGLFTGLSITAAVIASVTLDQFGLIGFRQHTISPARMLGCRLHDRGRVAGFPVLKGSSPGSAYT
jgi:bacterial/archaeal transporter family-2 protein